MQPYVVTISRQFASMGRTIAERMSHQLGIDYLDRDIVAQTAKRMGISVQDVSHHEEGSHESFFMNRHYLFNLGVYDISDEIFLVQKNIIRDLAQQGPCIIVGRCADSILSDFKNVINIYIYAPFEARKYNCTQYLMMDEKTAEAKIKQVDTARLNYRKRYCPEFKSVYDHKSLMINSSAFGIEGSADVLCHAVMNMVKAQA